MDSFSLCACSSIPYGGFEIGKINTEKNEYNGCSRSGRPGIDNLDVHVLEIPNVSRRHRHVS